MTINPVASAMDALVAHLLSTLDFTTLPSGFQTATVRRGWPEGDVTLNMSTGPVLAVTGSQADEERIAPYTVDVGAAVAGVRSVAYKIANVTIPMQLDLWVPYRAMRDDAVPLVEAAFFNQLPGSAGLWLTQSDYHGRPLGFEIMSGPRYTDEADQAQTGEWRATWSITCTTDKVAITSHPDLTQIDTTTTTTTGDSGIPVVETVTLAP